MDASAGGPFALLKALRPGVRAIRLERCVLVDDPAASVVICAVEGCERRVLARGFCNSHYKRLMRHGDPQGGGAPRGRELETRFWGRVAQGEGCWIWQGATIPRGYGMVRAGGRMQLSHRVAWMLTNGDPGESQVLHTCDVRLCVNPDHLYLGDHAQNMRDRNERGRTQRGERHVAAKLTEEDVRSVRARAAAGESHASIAADFGLQPCSVWSVVARRTWKHVA